MKPALGHHFDPSSEQGFEIHDQATAEPGTCRRTSFHQEIDVARWSRLAASDRSENADVSDTVPDCDLQDFVAIQPDKLRGVGDLVHSLIWYSV